MAELTEKHVRAATEPVDDDGVGPALWFVAVLCVLAALLSRGLSSALPGIWVGADHIITLSKLTGAFLSQLAALWGWLLMVALALRVVRRDRLSTNVRGFAMGMVMIVFLSLAISNGALAVLIQWLTGRRVTQRLPIESGLVLLVGVVVFSASASRSVVDRSELRWAQRIVALVALAAGCRGAAVAAADYALAHNLPWIYVVGRVVATLGLTGLVLIFVATWLSLLRGETGVIRWGRAAAAGGVLLLFAGLMWLGSRSDAPGAAVLSSRLGQELSLRPRALLPVAVLGWLQLVGVMGAMGVLFFRPKGFFHAAVHGLLICSQAAPDMPLGAVAILLAGYGLLLAEPRIFPATSRRQESLAKG